MFDGKYVAVAMSISSQVNWACNIVVGIVFPFFVQYLGPYSFVPFAIVLLVCYLFAYFVLPETQGTTPEQLAKAMTRTLSKSMIYEPNFDDMNNNNIPTSSVNNNNNANANQIDLEWRLAMEQLQQEEMDAQNNGSYDYGFLPIEK